MNQRDVELLSSFLDGQLSPSDSARLEMRLKSDPGLVSVLDDLRAARGLLRQLPQRRAPRNFTLTRKMVGKSPPLPRTYPLFRFAASIATLLFFFTFGLNAVGRQLASQAPGFGMGGGGGGPESFSQAAPALEATEAPVAESAATQPPAGLAPAATPAPTEAADAARIVETPSLKAGDTSNLVGQSQPQVPGETQSPAPLISPAWQIGLVVVAVTGFLLMLLMRQAAIRRWRQK